MIEHRIREMDLLIQPTIAAAQRYVDDELERAGFDPERPVRLAMDHRRRELVFMQERRVCLIESSSTAIE